jgi:hypothetical protein
MDYLIPLEEMIPKGLYCYTPLEIVTDKETGMRMKVRGCPFYSTNHCALLNVEVDDQVKECSINDDIEEYNNE